MSIRGLAATATLGMALLLAGCGGGSGRSGTDLAVSGTLSPSAAATTPVNGGTAVVFTMTVANTGQYTSNNVTFRNSTTQISESTLAISCSNAGGAVCPTAFGSTMTVPSMPAGGKLVFTISGKTAQGANGTFSDTMNVNADSTDTDGNNNTATVTGLVASSDINVAVNGTPPTSLAGGETATLSYVIGNAGPATAIDVSITETLTSGLAANGAVSCVAAGGAVAPVLQSDGKTLLSTSLPMNATLTCSVPVKAVAGTNGTESSTLAAATGSDSHTSDNSAKVSIAVVSSDLGVSETVAPTQVGAGGTATFTAIVANPRGQGDANNVTINWTTAVPSGSLVTFAPTCAATGGGSCPTTLGPTMTLSTMPPGSQLTFTFVASTTSTDRGTISSTVQVSADGDPNTANNSATASTTVVNANNGSYSAFAADGRSYTLSIDFDANSYTMAGNGTSVTHSFTPDSSGNYVVSGNIRFRVATDLIVGGNDFAAGVLPYVAARSFATSLSAGGGQYDLATRNLPAGGGAAVAHGGTAQIQNGALVVCQPTTGITTVGACDPSAKTSYTVTGPVGNLFTGTDTTSGATYTFAVATSGTQQILLSAGTATVDGSQQFRIGLEDTQLGLIGGTLYGPSTTGDWVTMTLTASTYAYVGTLGSDSAPLFHINASNVGPFSMLRGLLNSNDQQLYVMQADPLAVAVDVDAGWLQVAVP